MKLEKIRYIEVKGNNYELGKAIGTFQKKRINELFDNLLIKKEILEISRKYFRRHQKFFPEISDELRGIAEGSGIDLLKLFAFNLFEDKFNFRTYEEKCLTIFWRDKNKGFIGHNEEEFVANYGKLLLVKAELENGARFLSLNYPGLLCGDSISINSYGVIHALATVYPIGEYNLGFARSFIGRKLLESKSINDSLNILLNYPSIEGLHFLVYSKDGKAKSIEIFHEKLLDKNISDILIHSNHYLLKPFDKIPQNYPKVSLFKIARAKNLIKKLHPLFENMKLVLSDHLEFPMSICRHPNEKDFDATATLASVIVDLKDYGFYVANGNPCENLFFRFDLQARII